MLITRCPNCETTFRVRMEQLNLRGGRVRCGHCHVPFSALGSLEELPEETATTQLNIAPYQASEPAASTPASTPVSASNPVPPVPSAVQAIEVTPGPKAEAPELFDTAEIAPIDLPPTAPSLYRHPQTEIAHAAPIADATTGTDGDGFDLDFDIDDMPLDDVPPATGSHDEAAANEPEEEADKEFIELGSAADDADDAEAFDREFEKNLLAGEPTDTVIDDDDIDEGDDVPHLHTVFHDADIPAGAGIDPATRAARLKARRVLLLGNVLLMLTGILLTTYVLRVELTRHYPGLRDALEQACQYFSCDVPYPRDADEVLLVGSDLTQAGDPKGGYHLAVTVRNHAHYPVAWPQLEITLTDRFERALTRRVLEPAEWLPASAAQSPAFEAQGELTSQITLASDSQVMGYRLGVFYR